MVGKPFVFKVEFSGSSVDDAEGLVYGWAVISSEDDGATAYVDLQGDHIPDEALVTAAKRLMQSARRAREMHARDAGRVLFAMPLTQQLKRAFGLFGSKSGLVVGIEADEQMRERVRSGELRGMSIGGRVMASEEVEID